MRASGEEPWIWAWAAAGSTSSAWDACCTTEMSPTLVTMSSRTAGSTRKKMLPSATIGIQ